MERTAKRDGPSPALWYARIVVALSVVNKKFSHPFCAAMSAAVPPASLPASASHTEKYLRFGLTRDLPPGAARQVRSGQVVGCRSRAFAGTPRCAHRQRAGGEGTEDAAKRRSAHVAHRATAAKGDPLPQSPTGWPQLRLPVRESGSLFDNDIRKCGRALRCGSTSKL